MKTDNTEKAKFFGNHLGCDLYGHGKDPYKKLLGIRNGWMCIYDYKGDDIWINVDSQSLLLTPLSLITDEDAIEVAKMALGSSKLPQNISITNTTIRDFGFSFWLNHNEEYAIDFSNFYNPTLVCLTRTTANNEYLHNCLKITDYLRFKGYALPWNGYSVEQLIEKRWVKLKETNNTKEK